MSSSDSDNVAALVAGDDDARRSLQRRTLAVVVFSQVLGGAGLAAGVTVGALLAGQMLGGDSLSGLPAALFTLGTAAAAFLIGRLTQSRGRRLGLGFGFAAGGLGAVGVVIAAVTGSVALLFVSLFVYGSGTATNLQARYAGTDLARQTERGTAVSVALVSTTVGAVAGPNLVGPLGHLARVLGIPALAGPFLLAAVAYGAAGAVLFALLRPDPFLVARHLTPDVLGPATPAGGLPGRTAKPGAGVAVGAAVMVLTQIAMVAIMTMTPVHMRADGLGMGAVGLVIGTHIGAMYLPSLITGVLVDRIGRVPMAVASGVTLLGAGLTAAVAESLGSLILALALLGLGWNFGLISGTALVVDATVSETRARTQGSIDVFVALGGAGGGALSGFVMAGAGYAALSLGGGILSLLLIPVLFWARRDRPGTPHQRSGTET